MKCAVAGITGGIYHEVRLKSRVPAKTGGARGVGAWARLKFVFIGISSCLIVLVSVVVPAFREAVNIEPLSAAIDDVFRGSAHDYEVIIVDDDSGDGTDELCRRLESTRPIRLEVRRGARGLATAVLRGFEIARGEIVVVMDADLSHPAGAIPEMVALLEAGRADFVVGSRYVEGGSTHANWGVFRVINSRLPTALVRPLVKVRDPLSGFFAFRRDQLPPLESLDPVGFKIGLELLVKGGFRRVREVPIHFGERLHGASKLGVAEQLSFLRHLGALYVHELSSVAALSFLSKRWPRRGRRRDRDA